MRSIKARYVKIQNRNPNLGTHPCLCKAVRHRRFSRKSLLKAFNELMPKEEYAEEEKKELIDYLEYVTNLPEEVEIMGKNSSGTVK